MSAPLAERILEASDSRWVDFVDASTSALPYHRPAWLEVLSECYGFRPFVLGLEHPDGSLTAALPMMEARDLARGRRWISLPFTDRCPALVESEEAEAALAALVTRTADDQGVRRVEVRGELTGPSLDSGPVAVGHELELAPGYEALERGFSSATRRNTKKATRSGLEVRLAETEDDVAKVFYDLQLRTRRRLGVPAQPRRFFSLLWRRVLEPGHGHALLVLDGRRAVAGAVFLTDQRTVIYKYGASDERKWSLRPNNLLFAEAIRAACEANAETFDFGRTDTADEGLRAFKAGWGAAERPLVYTRTNGAPGLRSSSAASRLATATIQRSPHWVVRGLGEVFYRYAG